eukprot:1249688-Pleurochrysis_carterae.AAC.1
MTNLASVEILISFRSPRRPPSQRTDCSDPAHSARVLRPVWGKHSTTSLQVVTPLPQLLSLRPIHLEGLAVEHKRFLAYTKPTSHAFPWPLHAQGLRSACAVTCCSCSICVSSGAVAGFCCPLLDAYLASFPADTSGCVCCYGLGCDRKVPRYKGVHHEPAAHPNEDALKHESTTMLRVKSLYSAMASVGGAASVVEYARACVHLWSRESHAESWFAPYI